jgi:hypothetical protein
MTGYYLRYLPIKKNSMANKFYRTYADNQQKKSLSNPNSTLKLN